MRIDVFLVMMIIILGAMFFTMSPFSVMNIIFIALTLFILIFAIGRNIGISNAASKTAKKSKSLDITNMDIGGVFKLANIKGYNEDLTLKVMHKHLYQQGNYMWFELECQKGDGEKAWVTVDDDDETVVSLVLEKLDGLSDIGMTADKLKEIDDNERGNVKYKNNNYKYVDSDKAIFYKYCDDGHAEELYYWDFHNMALKEEISVEKWGNNEYLVYYSQIVPLRSITVYSISSEENK